MLSTDYRTNTFNRMFKKKMIEHAFACVFYFRMFVKQRLIRNLFNGRL